MMASMRAFMAPFSLKSLHKASSLLDVTEPGAVATGVKGASCPLRYRTGSDSDRVKGTSCARRVLIALAIARGSVSQSNGHPHSSTTYAIAFASSSSDQRYLF